MTAERHTQSSRILKYSKFQKVQEEMWLWKAVGLSGSSLTSWCIAHPLLSYLLSRWPCILALVSFKFTLPWGHAIVLPLSGSVGGQSLWGFLECLALSWDVLIVKGIPKVEKPFSPIYLWILPFRSYFRAQIDFSVGFLFCFRPWMNKKYK